jgi:poly-beta-1,6-N-acetyl-D-glucosamine synthase
MTLFLLIAFGIYFLLLLVLLTGWEIGRRKVRSVAHTTTHHLITVIIPFRNEASRLPAIVNDLYAQDYAQENFTVLFVDDHSADNSADVLKAALQTRSGFTLLTLPVESTGKKRAIQYGIQHASGNLIVTTDADCALPHTWLRSINQAFQNEKIKMVFGGVKIEPDNTVFSKFQALEFSSLIGSAAATLGLGFPTMCNGANLAYRKSAYTAVDGFEGNFEIASGDDEFLMRKINVQYPGGISFLYDTKAVVSTLPQATLGDFVNQRLRWAGKWKHNESTASKLVALFVLMVNTSFVVFVALAVAGKIDPPVIMMLACAKIIAEFVFLTRVNGFLKQPVRIIYFLALQFLYPLYVMMTGFLSQAGTYSWKGRSLSHKL